MVSVGGFQRLASGRNVLQMTEMPCYILMISIIYLAWCDINFFTQLGDERTQLLASNKSDVMTKYSVKLRMLPPLDLYVYLPFCNWADRVGGISNLPWISPNLITFMHFTIAVCCGWLFASSDLLLRRIACIMFEVRSCLDVLDGVVYRAQSQSSTFVSRWGSKGYWIDGMADVCGALFCMLGTIYRYHQHPPLKDRSKEVKYKKVTKEDSDAEMATSFLPQEQDASSSSHRSMRASERHSWEYALKVCLLTGLSVIARSRMWDHFTKR